jgi:hypothetical protein
MSTLQQADAEAAAVAVAPRVTLEDILAAIASRYDLTAKEAIENKYEDFEDSLYILSICILVMRNGFTIIGKSAPASPKNFNADLGRKLAYEDAVRQLWPLMGYALRDRLAAA